MNVDFLKEAAPLLHKKHILVGYDGFIDTLVRPVKIYDSGGNHVFFDTIEEFGNFIAAHAHKSTSIQYKLIEKKPGGNTANIVKAFDALGLTTTIIGMFSAESGAIDPLFADLGKERYSFCPAGSATVLEFDDGKIFLSSASVNGLDNSEKIIVRIENAFPAFRQAIIKADVIAFLNWSELPFAHDLWNDIYIQCLSSADEDNTRIAFFDLCDTAAKSSSEVEALVMLIRNIGKRRKTILSLNKNEAMDINQKTGGRESSADKIGEYLFKCFSVHELIIHQHNESIAVSSGEGLVKKPCVFNDSPVISTGAGDHFNAAYCYASLAGLPLDEKLAFANFYSGAYIAKGFSPGLDG